MLAYVLFGETNIGRRRIARFSGRWPACPPSPRSAATRARPRPASPPRYLPLFRVGQSISGFPAVGGNRGRLLGDSDDVIDHIVADIDAAARPRPHLLLHLARRHQRPEGGRGAEARRRARRHLPGDGRRSRQPRHGPLRALAGDGGGRRPARRGAADRLPALAPAQGPDRHAQPPQDRGDRQPHHLLRQQQLRRRRLRHQAALRALGRRDDALRGADRAAEPARLRQRLDGARQRGPERPASPSR